MIIKTRKLVLTILFILALLPCVFYGGWVFYSYKFKQTLVEQIKKSFTFYYEDCKMTGFPSTSSNLTFIRPILYFGDEINKVIIRFEELEFTKKFNEDVIFVKNSGEIKAKLNGEKFFINGIKNADIFFNNDKEDYLKLILKQQNIEFYTDDTKKEIFSDIDFNIETEVEQSKNKIVDYQLYIQSDGKKFIEQNIKLQWDKTNLQPEYDLDIRKIYLDKGNIYKIEIDGRAKISFTYRYNFNGEISINIDHYKDFLNNLVDNARNENDRNIMQKISKFLQDYSEIKDDNLKIKLHGSKNSIFLGEKNLDDILLDSFIMREN
jgi:hypothetical protein